MFYFHSFRNHQNTDLVLLPFSFIMPQLYPESIDENSSEIHLHSTPNTLPTLPKPFSRPNRPSKVQKKKEIQVNEKRIFQKQVKENRMSNPERERIEMKREQVSQIDEEGKVRIRIDWRNRNRNIIPNIMNQLLSYLTKPFKSSKIVSYLFEKQCSNTGWNTKRYYNYLRIIKEKTLHYLDQSDFKKFFITQSPHCEIYSPEEQQFYMKICRILIAHFLKNEVVLIASTSTRMNYYNRKIHLVGRQVLLKIFQQTAAQFRNK